MIAFIAAFSTEEGGRLVQHQRTAYAASFTHALLCTVVLLLGSFAGADASAKTHRRVAAQPDLVADFAALAQNRPRRCVAADPPGAAPAGWKLEFNQCAWQSRLRMRRWIAPDPVPPTGCVSGQARFWAWARGDTALAPGQPLAWRAHWGAHSLDDGSGAEKRIVVLQRAGSGQWSATEWRWNPSPREATRRWQEGRWKLLAALSDGLRQPAGAAAGPPENLMLLSVWEHNLGARAGEIGGEIWRWQRDGLCLRSDPVGLGQQQLHIPYSFDDGRLEQRAAMQLQLARRYPKAVWLTPFRLIPAAPHGRGGAKFDAVWIENAEIKGQLWIPTKGDGPVVRLRINATLPAAAGAAPNQAAVARAAETVERELAALAQRWNAEHE
jgi:hypothetical protein